MTKFAKASVPVAAAVAGLFVVGAPNIALAATQQEIDAAAAAVEAANNNVNSATNAYFDAENAIGSTYQAYSDCLMQGTNNCDAQGTAYNNAVLQDQIAYLDLLISFAYYDQAVEDYNALL
ncbi:MAG TPA: hypothetical protein VG839_04995 [Asticcacaulis sp.]|nr:hypothetical protein [Asticcacaulis sp.]